ncbi:EXS family-domain-containing protein [Gigaspora rosea]|uniref:EXS family-domain-containing protein n=1 Tax=Gigaspora rosea TaxID=44941 RepID=A0A397VC79_9GLOM|nr:EXS family-domain-containing protein [Gigaspora rosea]
MTCVDFNLQICLKVKLEKIQQAQYVELHLPTTYFSNVCESPISEHDGYQHFPFFDENQSKLQNEKLEPIKPTTLSEPLKPPPIPLKIKISSFSRTHSILTKVPSRSRILSQRAQIISIDTIKNQLHPDEIEFFEALDIELKIINEFYEEKELDAKERFTRINQAYEELKTLKRVNLPNPSRSDWTSKLFKERDNNGSNSSTNESSLAAISYKDAKKKMKKAICEFYRGTEMLKNYRNLNYAGFKKILEKFDMITRLNGSEIYIQKINQSNFVKSKKLDTLMRDTEYIYSKLFGGNSRSHAMKKLKTPNRRHKGRMIISPFIGIEFRDFILADHFNSLSYSLVALQLLPCFAFVYYTNDYNKILISKIIYIIAQLIATIYTNIWDLKQDWGLFQLDSSNFLLRDELAYKYNWIYYIAMCNNIILRFSWILYFITDNFWVKFFMAFGEILRRWQWDIFRIENEHLTNCESDYKRKQEEGKKIDEVDNIESHRKLPKIIEHVEISID